MARPSLPVKSPAPSALSLVPCPVAAPMPRQLPWALGGRPTALLQGPLVAGADNAELDSICSDDRGTDKGH